MILSPFSVCRGFDDIVIKITKARIHHFLVCWIKNPAMIVHPFLGDLIISIKIFGGIVHAFPHMLGI